MNQPRKRRRSRQTPQGRRTPRRNLPASPNLVEAPKCPSCPDDDRELNANTFVYSTRKPKRYCKCRRCGHTWTYVPPKPHQSNNAP